jgi:NAD(P)-dependent dehydrogenase (short-subunit alcohol dehydrogenase family)
MVMSSGKSGNMNESFDGSIAFVTGATQGIGKATALAFSQRGASVAILDIQREGVEQTASEIEKKSGVRFWPFTKTSRTRRTCVLPLSRPFRYSDG